MAYNTVTVTTAATLILAGNESRRDIKISNTSNSLVVYLGQDSSVTTSNGYPLYEGQSLTETRDWGMWLGPIYGIVASSSADVRYWTSSGT